MCKVAAFLQAAFVAQVYFKELAASQKGDAQRSLDKLADKLIDKSVEMLLDRSLKASPVQHADLDNATLEKPGHISMPRPGLAPLAIGALSRQPLISGTRRTMASAGKDPSPEDDIVAQLERMYYPDSRAASTQPVKEDTQEEEKDEKKNDGVFGVFGRKFKKFSADFGDEMYEFAIGGKEKRWSPDRRPEDQQGVRAGPGPNSQLAWGTPEAKAKYELMMREQKAALYDEDVVADRIQDQPLGAAAVSMVGESAKGTRKDAKQIEEAMALAHVPAGDAAVISGPIELAELIHGKYGCYHDASILRNVGQIAFNIYGPSLGQANFPYTESQYLEKLEGVTDLLKDLEQSWYVKSFLLSPIKPRNGLPSRPQPDTAVTTRLNLSPTWDDVRNQDVYDAWLALNKIR
jgi:hypothetical protein